MDFMVILYERIEGYVEPGFPGFVVVSALSDTVT